MGVGMFQVDHADGREAEDRSEKTWVVHAADENIERDSVDK